MYDKSTVILPRQLSKEAYKDKKLGPPVIIAQSRTRAAEKNVIIYEQGANPEAPKPIEVETVIDPTVPILTAEQVAAELEAEEKTKAVIPPAPVEITIPEPEPEKHLCVIAIPMPPSVALAAITSKATRSPASPSPPRSRARP